MKNHWSIKLMALLLVAVSGFTLTVSGISVFINWNWGLYSQTPLEATHADREEKLETWSSNAARQLAARYLRDQRTAPGTSAWELWGSVFNSGWYDRYDTDWYEDGGVDYVLTMDGEVKQTTLDTLDYVEKRIIPVTLSSGSVVRLGVDGNFPQYGYAPEDYVWQTAAGVPLEPPSEETWFYDLYLWYDGYHYRVDYHADVICQVSLFLTQEAVDYVTRSTYRAQLMDLTYSLRHYDYIVALCSLGVLALAVLYLSFAAGKKPDTDEINPRGLNVLPLDLFAAGALAGGALLLLVGDQCVNQSLYAGSAEYVWLCLAGAGIAGAAGVLMLTFLLTALCAQARLGKWQWLKRTLAGRVVCLVVSWFGAGARKVVSESERLGLGRKAWTLVRSVYRNMPLSWQWLALYGGLCLLAALINYCSRYEHPMLGAVLTLAAGSPVVIYTAHGFGRLRDAARRMSQGDLDTKINTYQDILHGSFAEFAQDLNALGDACTQAAREKMKSERMKSELITNVSHDIKTPLTSIINYVDLLQRAQNEEQRREYLEVLDRQSQRLKKLIEDLMEMSKANSGNLTVELQSTDVIEAVSQALGEFSDALSQRNLTVIFQPQGPVMASCDGKLLWRVMSNVLGNVVKYALPGTRVYCDVTADERRVWISVKNISRDPLNITADELMERFVRGDQSRNSEGNGLGLNIAKSLMQVQNGDLTLTVDGDLFKVTLLLNAQW